MTRLPHVQKQTGRGVIETETNGCVTPFGDCGNSTIGDVVGTFIIAVGGGESGNNKGTGVSGSNYYRL